MKKSVAIFAVCLGFFASAETIKFNTFTPISGALVFDIVTSQGNERLNMTGQTTVASNNYSLGTQFSVNKISEPSNQLCIFSPQSGMVDIGTQVTVTCDAAQNVALPVSVTGLNGTLSLQANNGRTLSFNTNTTQSFSPDYKVGEDFSIIKATEPTNQTCTVTPESGTVSPTAKIDVVCKDKGTQQTLGVEVSGLTGALLITDGNDELSISKNGLSTFTQTYDDQTAYELQIVRQPAGQTCTFTSGQTGKVSIGTEALISCNATIGNEYTLSINAVFPSSNSSNNAALKVSNNKNDKLTFTRSGETQQFNQRYLPNEEFTIKIDQIPSGQVCTFTESNQSTISGSMTANNTVNLVCRAGGSMSNLSVNVSGLSGTLLVAYGADSLTITTNGEQAFAKMYPTGQSFELSLTPPNNQVCNVTTLSNSIGAGTEATIQCQDKPASGAKSLSVSAPTTATVGEPVTFKVTSENFENDCVSKLTFYPEFKAGGGGNETAQFISAPNGGCEKTLTTTHVYASAGTYDVTFYAQAGTTILARQTHQLIVKPKSTPTPTKWTFTDGFETQP